MDKEQETMQPLPEIKYCTDMPMLRSCIDDLDHRITDLIAERTFYIAQAARIKEEIARVYDEDRIEYIVEKVSDRMAKRNAPVDVIEATYRAMIGACIRFELAEFKRLREHSK